MEIPTGYQTENCLPILSSQNQGWENILVEQFHQPPGEGRSHYSDEHAICLSLAPVQSASCKSREEEPRGLPEGDISITPARVPCTLGCKTTTCIFALPLVSSRALPRNH